MVKSKKWGGWGAGPCDYCVSPSPKNWVLGIFSLGHDFWVRTWDRRDGGLGLGLGLDNKCSSIKVLTVYRQREKQISFPTMVKGQKELF